jgi:prephenate dehydrogenase
VIPINNADEEANLVKDLFPEAVITVIDADEHDRIMALTLSLTHFMNIIFADLLSDEDLTKVKSLEGTTFQLQRTLAESVLNGDPALQASIQMSNEYTRKYLKKFLEKAKMIETWISEKEKGKIINHYHQIQNSLRKEVNFRQSYERMYEILERL